MRTFEDQDGGRWVATAREEDTSRHHGRWYLVLHPADDEGVELVLPEIRWQTRDTAERTIRSMAEFELQRRLRIARGRSSAEPVPARDPLGEWEEERPGSKGGTA